MPERRETPAPRCGSVEGSRGHSWLPAWWCCVGLAIAGLPAYLVGASDHFDWARPVSDIPAIRLTIAVSATGLVWLTLAPLVRATLACPAHWRKRVLALVLVSGAVMRLALVATEPALEDDGYRFLWEGAMVAHGLDPYAATPLEARNAAPQSPLGRLAAQAGPVLDRVNHPWLASTYPPVALAAFAASHLLSPWDLRAWRLMCVAFDAAAMGVLLALLAQTGRPLLWSALYWWSPLVIKETANSGHFDALPVALTLAALWLAARRRQLSAVGMLALAAGVKLWPVALLPLLARPLLPHPRRLAAALAIVGSLVALWTVLPWQSEHSGLSAYARGWSTNSALTPLVEGALRWLAPADTAPLLTRLVLGSAVVAFSLWMSRNAVETPADLVRRASLVVAAVLLLAPAQFPWYAIWLLPFLAFVPAPALLSVPVVLSLYYLSFHFAAIGSYATYTTLVVWAEWLPVWGLLVYGSATAATRCGLAGAAAPTPACRQAPSSQA